MSILIPYRPIAEIAERIRDTAWITETLKLVYDYKAESCQRNILRHPSEIINATETCK